MTDLSKIKLENVKQLNKKTVEDTRVQIAESVNGGFINGMEVFGYFKFLDKIWEGDDKKNNGLRHLIKDSAMTEFDFHGEKTVKLGAFEVTTSHAGGRYDFSADPVWVEINIKVEEATALMKEREKILLAIPEGKHIIERVDDEEIKLYKPIKKGGNTGLQFTLK